MFAYTFFIVRRWIPKGRPTNQILGDNRDMEPPESISNSEVKRVIADDSVGLPHVKVGHHQVIILKTRKAKALRVFLCA